MTAIDMNMSFEQLVPTNSNFMKKEDVGEDGVILTISGFSREQVNTDNSGTEEKVCLIFAEHGFKPMVLNSTNAQLLRIATGGTTPREVVGKQIVVYNDPTVSFGSKVTGGLRIKRIPGAPRQATRQPEPPPYQSVPDNFADYNDDIPI